MKLMQGEKKNIQTLIIVLFIQIIILNHSAYGQFHWGGIHWELVKVSNKYFGVFWVRHIPCKKRYAASS